MGTQPTPLPVACTLKASDLEQRRRAWAELVSRSLAGREPTPHGMRLRFQPQAARRLRELARLEADCCGFARWEVHTERDEVVLDVSSSGPGVDAVRELFR